MIPKGLLSEAALAWVITSKYLDGLPLYRQAALLGRFGGSGQLSRNTLAASVVRVGQAVQPVINLLRDALLDSFIVHGDETEVQVLKEPGRKAQAKSYMWVQMTRSQRRRRHGAADPAVRLLAQPQHALGQDTVRRHAARRRADERRLRALRGHCRAASARAPGLLGALPPVLQRGAAGVAQGQARARAIAGALHRAHRPAVQGRGRRSPRRAWMPRRCSNSASCTARRCSSRSRPWRCSTCMACCRAACWARRCTTSPRSGPSSRATSTTAATRSTTTPARTRSARSCVGRRNWLFADTVAGANASANLYSLLQTCMANGIDGYRYLRALLVELPKAKTVEDFEALLPWRLAHGNR